jgi:hypothetical protein
MGTRVTGRLWLLWSLALLLLTLTFDQRPPVSLDSRIYSSASDQAFRFVGWETAAITSKVLHELVSPERYLDELARAQLVLDYLKLVADIRSLDRQTEAAYADPAVSQPSQETSATRARVTQMRYREESLQPLAEAILEEQVATALSDSGFSQVGQGFPPVLGRFTPLPLLLVVSPRDHIESTYQLSLRHGLDLSQREALEDHVDALGDLSSLVTSIGGLAAYPAMLLESSSISWVTEVCAHEWAHHYLALRPLGWYYNAGPEMRTINETVASIVGKEAGQRVLARSYPSFMPPPSGASAESIPPESTGSRSSAVQFDFRSAMRETRIRVDDLLAQGKIDEAEAYMEQRRQVFVANGYQIRKLNQAYFAFHGAYADEPGAAGEDPIGPAVQELRSLSPDVGAFVSRISWVSSTDQLWALLQEAQVESADNQSN